MTYVPPANAKECAIKPGEGWISCGWLAFEEWRKRTGKTYETTSEALSVGAGTITLWKKGRIPRADHGRRIEVLAGVPPLLGRGGSMKRGRQQPWSQPRSRVNASWNLPRSVPPVKNYLTAPLGVKHSPARQVFPLESRQRSKSSAREPSASFAEWMKAQHSRITQDFESFLEDIIGATCDALSARGLTDPAIKGEIAQALRRRGELRDRQAA